MIMTLGKQKKWELGTLAARAERCFLGDSSRLR